MKDLSRAVTNTVGRMTSKRAPGMRALKSSLAVAAIVVGLPLAANAQQYDQMVTPDFFLGDGNDNAAFTLVQQGGVELALRGKFRFDAGCQPQNFFNSNNDGTYSFDAVDIATYGCGPSWADGDTPEWSFEWSINTDYDDSTGIKLDDLTYELGMDADPTAAGTDFLSFDPINVPLADHAFGDNSTLEGTKFIASDANDYANLIASYNVAQQSWNYEFFDDPTFFPGTPLEFFDADAPGVYDIYLKAFNGPTEVVSVTIQIIVGEGACSVAPNPVAVGADYVVSTTASGDTTKQAPSEAGIYAPDALGLPSSCENLVVYDPSAGFATGGGWIASPECALVSECAGFYSDSFEFSPTIAATQTADAWYTDRYAPAGFESALFDGENRLKVTIAAADYLPFNNAFYNYQGRKYDLGYGLDTYIAADLYIAENWANEDRHASIWATTLDSSGDISGYPIAGFTSGKGFRIFTQDTDGDISNGYNAGWIDIGFPDGFEYGHWYTIRAELTATEYRYYLNGELVFADSNTFGSVVWANMMLQAYNYGEDYEVYWDNVRTGPIVTSGGKATFGFVSKYKKGASVPTGNTQFNFKAGDLNFHSDIYDWLVVTGSNYAKFKGEGTVNGSGAPSGDLYKFQIWAGDNDPDTFRIKIWYEDGSEVVVYDNGMDQAIGGGQIMIHNGKGKK